MKLACTGFVSATAGSAAAANALLLVRLLDHRFEIDFFSKPSFVDPRPIVGTRPGFRFIPVNNHILNFVRSKMQRVPLVGRAASIVDALSYSRLVARTVAQEHQKRQYDLCVWLGDYSRGSVSGLPTVSFPQGPPGTDARSLLTQFHEIQQIAGPWQALKWSTLARLRLSSLGTPPFHNSDHFIVGSRQSAGTLAKIYSVDPDRISVLPYPIDLDLFRPLPSVSEVNALRVLWLGRIVPRKRLDLFLDGAARAINKGIDIRLTIVGAIGFIPGYEVLLQAFPCPERLQYRQRIDRTEVPALLSQHDVLAQPSVEEDFGSSVAEAQACGLPVIVGHTNGNSDYLCSRDIHLADEGAETFAEALIEMYRRKKSGQWGDSVVSRSVAEANFHIDRVTGELIRILELVLARNQTTVGEGSIKSQHLSRPAENM
ncbi:MAG: glycosyltransferase family 4 protein [Verrucomicrobia bacterium]|nr:glycosyltransferase family 4 protein [Verrucomicrobiota bacterium]